VGQANSETRLNFDESRFEPARAASPMPELFPPTASTPLSFTPADPPATEEFPLGTPVGDASTAQTDARQATEEFPLGTPVGDASTAQADARQATEDFPLGTPVEGEASTAEADAQRATEDFPLGTPMVDDPFTVERGQLTFDAEGMEKEGPFFSRRPHWPGGQSGVTIGRGYDLGSREPDEVIAHLTGAGVPTADAELLAQGAGLRGEDASAFTEREDVRGIVITPEAQQALFSTVYDEHEEDVRRISNDQERLDAYGRVDWENLHPAILDLAVDMRYRGDYRGETRQLIQPLIVANDLQGLYDVLSDRDRNVGEWNVPEDRFQRRADFLREALAAGA
jgi:hypothetical protein